MKRALLLVLLLVGTGHAQSFEVAPPVLVFSAFAGHGNPTPQSITVPGTARYQVTSQQAPWLTVSPRSGPPGSLSVSVKTAGLSAGIYQDSIAVSSATRADTVPVLLFVAGPPATNALYDVELTYTGYVGLVDGAPNCKVNTQGYDRLVGTIAGFETASGDDDVVYTGLLRRETNIDFCETKKHPTEDQRAWCVVSLIGAGAMNVELTVAADSLAGAYLKATPEQGSTTRTASSDCDSPERDDALNGYQMASDGGAASPNGQQIDDIKGVDPNNRPQTFSANGAARLRVGTYPPAQPGGWTLHVIRRLP